MQFIKRKIELGYGEIEAAIAQVLEIKPDDVPALRASLRHLRNMGLPDIPNPGSGRKVSYTTFQAMEMLIALVLQHGGITSRRAVIMSPDIAHWCVTLEPPIPYDQCVVISQSAKEFSITILKGLEGFRGYVESLPIDSFFFMNVSSYQLKLEKALKVRIDHKPQVQGQPRGLEIARVKLRRSDAWLCLTT